MASQSLALYLKWRPLRFEDVVGQDHITQTLVNALRTDRIAHAYLFTGPRGTGKTTMARLLAKAVNCLDEDVGNRPCNTCHICTAINEGRLLDLIEMDAASNTGVDNVREAIREKVGFSPNEARYKVYVIDEVHMLSTSAFNALLKTLEEPPEHVIFILATTEPHKILPTIISRCQRFDFGRISMPALVNRLRHITTEEGFQADENALYFIARMSTGCARDAISLLDQLMAYGDQMITNERVRQVLGLSDTQTIHALAIHLAHHNIGRGLEMIHQAVEHGVDMRQFAQQIIEYLRVLMLFCVGDNSAAAQQGIDAETQAEMMTLAKQMSTRELVGAIRLFNQAQLDMRSSDRNQIALELAFVEAALQEQAPAAAQLPAAQSQRTPVMTQPTAHVGPVVQETPRATRQTPAASTTTHKRPTPPAGSTTTQKRPTPSAASTTTQKRPTPPVGSPTLTPPSSAPKAKESQTAAEETAEYAVDDSQADTMSTDIPQKVQAVPLQEINTHWQEIRQEIRRQDFNAEALLNSAAIQTIEDRNNIVFVMPSKLLAEKMERAETKRVIERVFSTVLGKPCRIRATVNQGESAPFPPPRDTTPPFEQSATAPRQTRPPAAAASGQATKSKSETIHQEAMQDPVVQELLRQGGKVRKVEPKDGN